MLRTPRLIERIEGADNEDRRTIEKLNAAVQRLDEMRAVEIVVAGSFARSKIAWKLATYQHVLLHRIVTLYDGAALAWNNKSTLTALLAARAVMETTVVFWALVGKIENLLENENLQGLDQLAQQGIFATRDPLFLKDNPDYKAVNILTSIIKIDRIAPGALGHYERLSERCHPNTMGHNYMFAELDRSDGTVRFVDERQPQNNQSLFLGGIMLVALIAQRLPKLDRMIEQVAELQHRVQPISRSEES